MTKRREARRQEAKERQEKYDSLSLDQKIALVKKRGGSKKELARLMAKKGKKES